MNAVMAETPYELLRSIEARSREKALGLPQQIEVRRTWSGIGFRFGPHHFVAPMGAITEILEYPSLTRVPSALPWVRGIANVRGSLLPIMDLKGFVTGEQTDLTRRSRVLVVQRGDLHTGLLVDEVLGLRHFFDEEKLPDAGELDPVVQDFVEGAYRQGEQNWGVFSLDKLVTNPRFREVAAQG